MPIYLFLYFFGIIGLLTIGIKFFGKYIRYDFGKYFVGSMLSYSLWLTLYFLSFTTTYNQEILLILSRMMYGLALFAMYSMVLFIVSFPKNNKNIFFNILFLFIIILLFLSIFSPYIIQGMVYDSGLNIYYEGYGFLYPIYVLLYLINPFFVIISYLYNKENLSVINKIRLKYILFGYLFLSLLHIVFLAIFPFLGIWIFQKEQVLFFIPLILAIWYSINRYHFSDIKIGFGKIIVFLLSMFWSIIGVNVLKYYYAHIDERLITFWGITQDFGVYDLILGIIIFLLSHKFFTKVILGNYENTTFHKELTILKSKVSFITDFQELNDYLQKKFQQLFKIKYVEITIFKKDVDEREIFKYFTKDILRDLFINDIVFIEENKNKFDYKKIKKEIHPDSYLILPLFNKSRELIGIFSVSAKRFKDNYYTEEINELKRFTRFLEGHLQYMKTYAIIHDLTVNLDKKVDEQTIEYNNLISKQKDFISLVSHEVKGPIGSAIFQADSIRDDIKDGEKNTEYLVKELNILNTQLKDAGELVNRLFNVQKYEKQGFKLYKEKIDFDECIFHIFENYQRAHNNLHMSMNIENTIGFIEVDRTQFKQVIDNLFTNAIKFLGEIHGKIHIHCFKKDKKLWISIEDSGQGFKNVNISKIFDKYSTGTSQSIGLGMGLYLCKTIIELHGGQIKAEVSKTLGGAKFVLNIPM